MTNYIDSQIIPILKFVDEEILSSHIDDFIKYQIAQRFATTNDILRYYLFLPRESFYLILTLNKKYSTQNDILPLRALEFGSFYDKPISSVDIFIYDIDDSYYFALYIDTKFSYFNSLYIENNTFSSSEKIDDFIFGTFNLDIDNIYNCSKNLRVQADGNKKISTIALDNTIKEIQFSSMQLHTRDIERYIKYLWSILALFLIYLAISILIVSQDNSNSKYNPIQTKPQSTIPKKDFVSTLLNITEEFDSCDISILEINIEDDVVLKISSSSKMQLDKCLQNKQFDILSINKNNDGIINASLKYNK